MAANRPSHVRARAAVLPLPHRQAVAAVRDGVPRTVPARVLGVLALVLATIAGAYALARETSIFAIERLELRGAPAELRAPVRAALGGWLGSSLVGLDADEVLRAVEAVPWVERATLDRAFPNTLRVEIRAERPAAVLRRGRERWLVSGRGRVLERLRPQQASGLPRVWVRTATPLRPGETLPDAEGGAAARALAPLVRSGFPVAVATAALRRGELFFRLRSGVELRFGRPRDLLLKLAIARRIVPALPTETAYLDVSVPERPVAGTPPPPQSDPQVSG